MGRKGVADNMGGKREGNYGNEWIWEAEGEWQKYTERVQNSREIRTENGNDKKGPM